MMPSQPRPTDQSQPRLRPLWQLLLAAQTDQLPPLTNQEHQALLEFLSDLVTEDSDVDSIMHRVAQYLSQK